MDREELVLRAALVLRRISELAQRVDFGPGQWERVRRETEALRIKWRLLMKQLRGTENGAW
jgi:hypothetical protein